MKEIKSIQAVKSYGIIGYQVTFSVSDLYHLNHIASMSYNPAHPDSPESKLADTIHSLIKATIGDYDTNNFDFLQEAEDI